MLAGAASGTATEGDWLVADRQTTGRGRQGREWVSPAGNLYASGLVVLRPGDPPAPTLALVAGIALHDALALPSAMLKWPNDMLVGTAKLAGILLERAGDAVVIGVGVNVASRPDLPDRAATSLAALGDPRRAGDLAAPLAHAVACWVEAWRRNGLMCICRAWLARAHRPGTPLAARLPDGIVVEGTFDGLSGDCALMLRLADGTARVIHAGDVFLI